MTPSPPVSNWLSRAGNGFQISKRRKRTKAVRRTGMVRGSVRTESSMPATSSITMTPGSFVPSTRSTREPAHIPSAVTAMSVASRAGWLNGMSQRATRVRRLPTVPGATGQRPAPPTLAMARARRSERTGRLLSDQFVAVHLDDGDLREAPRPERGITQQHDPIDLGRLPGQTPLEGEGRIGTGAVHEDGPPRAEERLLARPGEPVLGLLHQGGALRHQRRGHLPGHARRRRAVLGRVREDAEPIEGDVLDEVEEVLEGRLGLAGEPHEHRGADRQTRDGVAELGDDLLHAPG